MSDTDAAGQENGAEIGLPEPGIRILAQFIRDLSFENPRAPDSLRAGASQPSIDMGVEMNARGRDDGFFEIAGVPQEELEPVLLVECPRFLFPFARRVIADVTSDGGFPPFLLDPIDFAGVYAARSAQAEGAPQIGNA